MTAPDLIVSFRPIPAQSRWQVEATWSDGRVQLLSGYATEEEAKSWIAFYSARWTEITLIDHSSRRDGKST